MRTLPLVGVFAALLFVGVLSAHAQLADYVVINEIDTNPPGDDAKSITEWVELYNPTSKSVDIGGWKIASTTVTKKTFTIPAGTTIKPDQFLIYSYTSLWFTDVSEKVQLRDGTGKVIDETPVITDQKNDFSSWQRKFDGVDSNTSSDWVFRTSSAGSSNGKLDSGGVASGALAIFVDADKRNYIFGETAIISGNVSKRVYQEKPYFTQQQITIHVDGPGNYDKKFTLYPDLNLQFKTQIKLDKVLGIEAGNYVVTATYGEADDTALFIVGDKVVVSEEQQEAELVVSTDKTSYIPGQRVEISAITNKIIPLAGLDYAVYDPKGKQVFSGKLFPTPSGKFSGVIFMTTVKPVYGTYNIIADYGKQHAETTFDLLKDIKDEKNIVLNTDKKVYGLGDTVLITGRSNKHVVALDVEILQTGLAATGKDTAKNALKIRDQVKLEGDSSFKYELKIPNDQLRLGDYRVTVSKEFGNAVLYFKVVENPSEFIPLKDDTYVLTDKPDYVTGEKLTITGHVIPKTRTSYEAIPVKVSITDQSGKPLSIISLDKKQRLGSESTLATYSFSAIPDTAGNYKIETVLNPSAFKTGTYIIKATYDDKMASTMFTVTNVLEPTNTKLIASTDKTIYGLGEKVMLTGKLLSGESAVKIILTKPDGKTVNAGAKIDASTFSWSWDIPQKDFDLADIRDPRQPRPSVFGNYKISVISPSQTLELVFKVSKNPATDTLEIKPLVVRTDREQYAAGEKLTVSGEAIRRQQGSTSTGGVVPDRVSVQIKTLANKEIYSSQLDFDSAGHFESTYDLPLTIFKDGKYRVTAVYKGIRADTTFEVKNNLPVGDTGKLTLTLLTDKEEYSPGETIHISGSTNKVIFLNSLDLVVIPEDTKINCGNFYCGLGGKKIDIARSYNNGIYSYDYKIPANTALGNYVVKADTEFGTFTKPFKIVEKKMTQTKPQQITEKFNRITDTVVDVPLFAQTKDQQTIAPVTLQGSMFTPKGSEASINLKVTNEEGQCIIGQDPDCLVSESTGGKYKVVTIGAQDYKVTYSGHMATLEKFSISPQAEGEAIPDSVWTLEMVNGDTKSRLYYEIVYTSFQ
ncbi:MAG TPA: lamin tail domain-containing protein [Candidatus Nitrosotenuis sp.]|nr:lamin tail domain-containing protein [Candidatus Nitrosotenuis sp.]